MTTGPQRCALMRRLLKKDTSSKFESICATQRNNNQNETVNHFDAAINELEAYVFSAKALSYQKRHMRRHMRKPSDVSVRVHLQRINQLNAELKEFPSYNDDQNLSEDELKELIEFAVPPSWRRETIAQGCDTLERPLEDTLEFFERLELVKGIEDNKKEEKPKANAFLNTTTIPISLMTVTFLSVRPRI